MCVVTEMMLVIILKSLFVITLKFGVFICGVIICFAVFLVVCEEKPVN